MIEKESWMTDVIEKLKNEFGKRLLMVGLQGSYRRNEPTEKSDFDIAVILDTLNLDDLDKYRSILVTMPEYEKACGFISGKQELLNWPKHEIFQFLEDTQVYYGTLQGMLPEYTIEDIKNNIKINSVNMYHILCHTYVSTKELNAEILKDFYKGTYYILKMKHYVETGEILKSKLELYEKLEAEDKEILGININWDFLVFDCHQNPKKYFEKLLDWTSKFLS